MCGIVVGRFYKQTETALRTLKHRGPDGTRIKQLSTGSWYFGHNRLAIVDLSEHGMQPLSSPTGMTMFNGEIYNYKQIYQAMEHKPSYQNEIYTLHELIHRASDFMRMLDGDFAIAHVDRATDELTLARDFVGVVPLYYQMVENRLHLVASEIKALMAGPEIHTVQPGEVLKFDRDGKRLSSKIWDPFGLTLETVDFKHLAELWFRAVQKRVRHSDVPVTVALSGGLDSSLILTTLKWLGLTKNISAVTVASDPDSDELQNALQLAEDLKYEHKVVHFNDEILNQEYDRMEYHLEDPIPNPVKWRGMVRNYLVAKHAPKESKVILTGEGADEIFCGYPSHALAGEGLKLEWKALGTFRSMPVINLDRVNKGGLAWGKEYRVPFLDRSLVLYVMACRKQLGKRIVRELAKYIGVPDYILNKPKYGREEDRLGEMYQERLSRAN